MDQSSKRGERSSERKDSEEDCSLVKCVNYGHKDGKIEHVPLTHADIWVLFSSSLRYSDSSNNIRFFVYVSTVMQPPYCM